MSAVVAQQLRPQFIEQGFEGFAVAQGLLQLRGQSSGDVDATAAALVGEGEDEGRMFVASGAGGAVRTDTGLADFGEGALDRGPEPFKLAQEVLPEHRIS